MKRVFVLGVLLLGITALGVAQNGQGQNDNNQGVQMPEGAAIELPVFLVAAGSWVL
jgi:hypothetical protein